jgi:hypothetical protein
VSKARDQVAKEQRIVRLVRSGATPQRVAEMFDLTDRRVRQIRDIWRDVPSLPPPGIEVDGQEVVRIIDRLELLREDLLMLAESTSHDGVRLAALRDRRELEVQLMQLKAELGLIPRNLAASNSQQELVAIVRGFVDVLRRRHVDEEVVTEVLALTERAPAPELEAAAA